jgi:hypothetical protein
MIMTHARIPDRAGYARLALETFERQVGRGDRTTLILDLITDLGHLASKHRIEFLGLVSQAIGIWAYEHMHPDGGGETPRVTISIDGWRPKCPRRRKQRAA